MPADKKQPVKEPHPFQHTVPASKKRNPAAKDEEGDDVDMTDTTERTADLTLDDSPAESDAIFLADIKHILFLLEKGVKNFEARYAIRALRATVAIRRRLTVEKLALATNAYFPKEHPMKHQYLEFIAQHSTAPGWPAGDNSKEDPQFLPEGEIFIGLLITIFFLDLKEYQKGLQFTTYLVDSVHAQNRRTLDHLAARIHFYWARFNELQNINSAIRPTLLNNLRTATVRHDTESEATLLNLLLRNYLQDNLFDQADKLIAKTTFPETATNNQTARFMFYQGKIRAIQLDYTDAHKYLQQAIRKAPQNNATAGFQQAAHKVSIIVQLLMGEIPERSTFRLPMLRKALIPYLHLCQAVRVGDLEKFQETLAAHGNTFRADKTYTLILRLRHNVIKTGIRMISLSYSRISMQDICRKLRLDSEEDAEFIVAKAIRDGVLDAKLDHENGFMQTKDIVDVYSTNEPQSAFHQRIAFCLDHHNNSVKAMRFPLDAHRKELESAKAARQREREICKEIEEGGHDSGEDEF